MTIIPIVIGALSTVTKGLMKGLEDWEVGRVKTVQTTALLKSARILWRVLETCGDLLSLKLQWKIISQCWCEKLLKKNQNARRRKLTSTREYWNRTPSNKWRRNQIFKKKCTSGERGVSSWCNGYSDGLRNRSKRVRSPLRYYVHFRANTLGKGMNPLILPAMG